MRRAVKSSLRYLDEELVRSADGTMEAEGSAVYILLLRFSEIGY